MEQGLSRWEIRQRREEARRWRRFGAAGIAVIAFVAGTSLERSRHDAHQRPAVTAPMLGSPDDPMHGDNLAPAIPLPERNYITQDGYITEENWKTMYELGWSFKENFNVGSQNENYTKLEIRLRELEQEFGKHNVMLGMTGSQYLEAEERLMTQEEVRDYYTQDPMAPTWQPIFVFEYRA